MSIVRPLYQGVVRKQHQLHAKFITRSVMSYDQSIAINPGALVANDRRLQLIADDRESNALFARCLCDGRYAINRLPLRAERRQRIEADRLPIDGVAPALRVARR